MITAIPVCAWTVFVESQQAGRRNWRDASTGRILLALALPAVLFVVARGVFAADAAPGPRPSLDPMRAYWLVARGFVGAFSLRGSDGTLHTLTTLGSNVPVPGRWIWAFVGGWLVVAIGLTVWGALVVRRPAVRVLTGLFALHVAILGIAAPMSSRQGHVPAVAAALLSVCLLRDAAQRLAAMAPPAAAAMPLIPAVAVILLVLAARPDHSAAAQVHAEATRVSRALVEQLSALAPPGRAVNLALVNMPGHTNDHGMHAATFANGLYEQVRLTTSGVATLDLWRVSLPHAPDDFTNLSVPVDVKRLRARLLDPGSVVLLFDERDGLALLTAERLDRLCPGADTGRRNGK